MTKLHEVYKCPICGIVVDVLHGGGGTLVCCGKPMLMLQENSDDASEEKHVPVVERVGAGVLVKVGSVPHPMDEDHYIEWIEVLVDGKVANKVFLKPGDAPEVEFSAVSGDVEVRAYCNLHGVWKVGV